MGIWYRQGTASVGIGQTAVTGTLTGWVNQVKEGDRITFDGGGKWYEIGATPSVNTELVLASAFAESTVTNGTYAIDRSSPKWTLASDLATSVAALLASIGTVTPAKTGTLTDAATITWDASLINFATLTLGGNRTISNPTSLAAGVYVLIVKQDATGSRTLAWGSNFKWQSGSAPTLTATANTTDVFLFFSDGTRLNGVVWKAFA